MRQCIALLSIIVSVALASGCGPKSDRPKLVPVSGTVSYKGQPLADGTVSFRPQKGRAGMGKIKDGKIIEVTSYELNDGLPVGQYKVAVQSMSNADDMYAEHKSLIPEKYSDVEKSELTADIKDAKENVLSFDLKESP
jgi:hypothetical protein